MREPLRDRERLAHIITAADNIAEEKVREEERKQWEKDRPKREAKERALKARRAKEGVGSVSEGYQIGFSDGYRGVNCYINYLLSDSPLYTEGFLSGYNQGFDAGSKERSKANLERMRNL